MSIFNDTQIGIMQDVISSVFAMPERKQAAEWDKVNEFMDDFINRDGGSKQGKAAAIEAQAVYISIAKEAKYFA